MSYEEALKKCPQDIVENWQEWLREQWVDKNDKPYAATIKSFKQFLQEQYVKYCTHRKNVLESKRHIRQQAIGMAYVPDDNMQSLQRYETTMDRLFERKLAALLKLQDIRNSKPLALDS